jgi:predicted DNA-binding protein (MmcQ/YjbR family)
MPTNKPSIKQVHEYLLSFSGAKLDYPFGEEVAVYKINDKMFALMQEDKEPVNLSLKSDPELANVLKEKYASVMPGYHLNKKHWISIVLSGEISWEEVKDLVVLSFNLVAGKN